MTTTIHNKTAKYQIQYGEKSINIFLLSEDNSVITRTNIHSLTEYLNSMDIKYFQTQNGTYLFEQDEPIITVSKWLKTNNTFKLGHQ